MSARIRPPVAALALFALLAPRICAAAEPPSAPPAQARFATEGLGFRSAGVVWRSEGVVWRGDGLVLPTGPLVRPVAESRGELVFELGADVLFDFDRAELRPEADPVLRALLAEVRAKLPRARFLVEGHTDAKGTEDYNQKLSERRAASVRDWLVRVGRIDPAAIATRGYGETRPVAPNARPDGSDDPVGRQRNRRVVITVRAGR
ncbi:MAG: OmpA family protein [Geminicoccaceae bacterium]|nr:OmpA family protein [Geminicoccaceae bacterium]MDW8339899.1 OmpA family protein [Geminicoccaceae bacterium]